MSHLLAFLHFDQDKCHNCCKIKENFNFLANLCGWGDWFDSGFVGNPEDKLCYNKAHIVVCKTCTDHGKVKLEPVLLYGDPVAPRCCR